MPSARHELLVEIFRARPTLLVELVDPIALGVQRPALHIESNESSFSHVSDLNADLVLTLADDTAVHTAIVVEVQLARRDKKPGSWAVYQAGAYRRFRCPAFLVVVAVDASVARWAAGPFYTGQTVLRPFVVSPETIVPITDPKVAQKNPELTLLSGLAHAREPVAEHIGAALWSSLDRPDNQGRDLYWDVLLHSLSDAVRRSLLVRISNYRPQSEWGKRLFREGEAAGRLEGEEVGRREGEAAGRLEGEAAGRLEGEAHGRLEALRDVLRDLLGDGGVELAARYEALIDTCDDPKRLRDWIRRAATAQTAIDVFGPRRGAQRR